MSSSKASLSGGLTALIRARTHGRITASDLTLKVRVRVIVRLSLTLIAFVLLTVLSPSGWAKDLLPVEPDLGSRVDELYDHEARLFIMLYSLEGNGKIDYITGRLVQEYARSNYGNPVYETEAQPLFYWWNHTMWNDPEQDGVNGNEKVYQENIEFDFSRYKPCLFNGQPC